MKRRELVNSIGVAAGVSALGGLPMRLAAQTKKISLTFESYVSENAGPSALDSWFLKELEKRSDGQVKIKRYWSSSLNKVGEHLGAVRDKTLDMTLISPGYYQAELPVTRGLEWYFRMNRSDALQKVCRDVYEQFEPLKKEWEQRHRSKILYWTNWNYAPMITRKQLDTVDQLRGQKIRGYGIASDVIERLGGTAVPIAAPEVFTGLERGTLDGVYGFDFITAIAYKLHEVAPHFTDIGDGPHAPAMVIINLEVWNAFPAEIKKLCTDLAGEIYESKYLEITTAHMRKYVEIAQKEGVKFNALSASEKANAKTRVQPAEVEAWISKVAKPAGIDGTKMQELIEAAIKKYDPTGKLPRPIEMAKGG